MVEKFDLNIEKILENRKVDHAVREIIANALDAQKLTKTKGLKRQKRSLVSSLVLSDYRISELSHVLLNQDDPAVLRPMGGGAGTSKKKRTTLKEVIAKLNEAFGENVSPVDGARTVNAIIDSVSADDVGRIQIRNSTNNREAIIVDGRLENIIKVATLPLKNNGLGKLATQILDDPQAIKPIAEMIYDLVNKKKHLDEEISEYANDER